MARQSRAGRGKNEAFTSYVATLQYGTGLDTSVPCPTMVGYDIKAGENTTIQDNPETGAKEVVIDLIEVTENVTYTVRYEPAQVSYTVHYYFQNIYDDLYVENTSLKHIGSGYTGTTPEEDTIKTAVEGFTCLYYEPDFIAADGSTVFASYYERNYYLMEFDCNGGYGAETLYVRYGSYISVPNPVKAGWVFEGWDLVRTEKPNNTDPLPTLNQKGQDRHYTMGSVTYDYTDNNNVTTPVTYYYISFKARYGDDISDMWPCDVFNSATRTDKDTENPDNNWKGEEAFVSAWNGEHHVKYSQTKGNETIKGVYEKLDDMLLFNSDYEDETEVSYLYFWENGSEEKNWNRPELYRYNIYLATYSGQDLTDLTTITRDGKTYYLASSYDTCDNSTVGEQTQVSLTGYDIKTFQTAYKDEYAVDTYEYKKLEDTNDATLAQEPGYFNSNLYAEGFEINFYYTAQIYDLSFYNYDRNLTDGSGAQVAYKEPLEKYFDYEGISADGEELLGANQLIAKKEYYPDSLEPGAYEFKGWYTTPECFDGTEVDWENMTMPDNDLMIYAKWTPVVHNVTFYSYYSDIEEGKKPYIPITQVEHGELIGTAYTNPPTAGEGYTFIGWFYFDEDNKKRFAPDTMEITRDLVLFAEWTTTIDTEYKIT